MHDLNNQKAGGGKSIAAFVLGVIGVVTWCIPLIGLPITLTGLVLGIVSLNKPSSNRSLGIAGVILNALFLILTIVNSAIGAYLGATGQLDF